MHKVQGRGRPQESIIRNFILYFCQRLFLRLEPVTLDHMTTTLPVIQNQQFRKINSYITFNKQDRKHELWIEPINMI